MRLILVIIPPSNHFQCMYEGEFKLKVGTWLNHVSFGCAYSRIALAQAWERGPVPACESILNKDAVWTCVLGMSPQSLDN